MTGYNHYAGCGCGWCVGGGRFGDAQVDYASALRFADAKSLLKRCNARTPQACFVNPNASCPVCGLAVFFYANQSGSKVYFDDLGPPWPKHPCTDNPRYRPSTATPAYGAMTVRKKGELSELIAAGNITGLFKAKVLG